MNELTHSNMGAMSTVFAGSGPEDDLSAGISGGYGIIGYRGKVWSIRYRGDEQQLMRDDGDGPRGSIEVVILKASPAVAKIWYEQGYVEGSSAAPDCFSTNGVTPDAGSSKPQAAACAACPKNAWGSRITPAGKQGKACSDSKRLAVVPAADIPNQLFGGPMLLRVPAASLLDLSTYGKKMESLGYRYYAIATRVSFDAGESYPKFEFNAIRALTDNEAQMVVQMRDGEEVRSVLAENEHVAATAPAQQQAAVAAAFEQAPQAAPVQAAPVQQQAPQAAPVQAAPVQQQAPQAAPVQAAPVQQQAPQPVSAPVQQVPQPTTPVQAAGGFGAVAPVTVGGNQPPQASQTPQTPQTGNQQPGTGAESTQSAPPVAHTTPQPSSSGPGQDTPPPQATPGPDGGAASASNGETPTAAPSAGGFEAELDAKLDALL